MAGLPIRQDYPPSDLRQRATRERNIRASLRLLAIANALEGMTRTEAARLAGMERQALHDAIQRFNAEGPATCRTGIAPAARSSLRLVSRRR
ncbi:helix-turn-helix domain-containing protein [Microvirga sp. BSC39]|uniref:helix-turn-helix domain-containing protein n=1 Tax=Microvirga sp. BSC39 TaxID=1549810 RepID=UPI0009E09EE1|nr:helix-turn-helix domain-containing protein [Microvirga sp. BSC39]